LSYIRDRRVSNPVVLTGDEHVNYAGELHLDGRNPGAAPIATEFVSTSVTSGGDGQDQSANQAAMLSANGQLKFINGQRGYVICDVNAQRWQTEFKVLDKVTERNGVLSTRTKLAIAAGDPRLAAA
jgi:alkaline phosphatase D